jgi:lactate dehydrogenase-like 2-hydroxyacid dehydrogenase
MTDMVKLKILSLYSHNTESEQRENICGKLEPGTFRFAQLPPTDSDEELHRAVSDVNVILSVPMAPFIDRAFLEAAKELKLVQFMSVGYDNIDLDAATEMGVSVANNAGFNAVAVAEHAIMMVLVLLKKAFYTHNGVVQGGWPQSEVAGSGKYLFELRGKTLGVVGLGNIGKEVAKRAVAFGARVLYTKRTRLSEAEEVAQGFEYGSLEALLRNSDIISVNAPLNEKTRGMIGREQIEMMKDDAVLVNTARSGLVDEPALAEALRESKLWGAGIDVPRAPDEQEAFRETFRGIDNVILTPHIASVSNNAFNQFNEQIADNLARITKGEKPYYLLNDVWKM